MAGKEIAALTYRLIAVTSVMEALCKVNSKVPAVRNGCLIPTVEGVISTVSRLSFVLNGSVTYVTQCQKVSHLLEQT